MSKASIEIRILGLAARIANGRAIKPIADKIMARYLASAAHPTEVLEKVVS